jgi:hypothetical protein
MDFREQADIEAALGADAAEALPELLRLADMEVRIPRLEVVALQRLAARDGKASRPTRCWRASCDLMSPQSHWLAKEIPGFADGAVVATAILRN